jgi:hypothetical protein
MPSLSCRDTGTNCDWFYRDADSIKLMIASCIHSAEGHKDIYGNFVKDVVAGKYKVSDDLYLSIKTMRE